MSGFSFTGIRRNLLLTWIGLLSERRKRILAWRLLVATGVELVVVERDGFRWNLPPDLIAQSVFVDGGFQSEELQAVTQWMRSAGVLTNSRDIVIDVGANIGTTCLPMV